MRYSLLLTIGVLSACNTLSGTTTESTPGSARTATLRPLPSATPRPVVLTPPPTDTPLPTFTPLPTATPIAYTIQQGDTLIAIAIQYDVSMEALEAANPGLNPTNLQIGQTVFIPPPSGEVAPNQALLPTPLPVLIGAFRCQPTPTGGLACLGEFSNQLDQPVANVAVKVTLVDADGATRDSQIAYAPLDLIPPGAAVPLGVIFSAGSQGTALVTPLTIDSGVTLAERYALLDVSNLVGGPSAAGFTLTATITNSTPAALQSIVAVGTVYNAAGVVAGFRTIKIDEPLAPGSSRPVELLVPGAAGVTRWTVMVQGRTQ